MSTSPAATRAPLPPEEPPAARVVSHGLRIGPVAQVWLAPEKHKSSHADFAKDPATGVEDSGDHGGITQRHVALDGARPVHHGNSGDGRVVLDGERLVGQRTRIGFLNVAAVVPGAECRCRRRRAGSWTDQGRMAWRRRTSSPLRGRTRERPRSRAWNTARSRFADLKSPPLRYGSRSSSKFRCRNSHGYPLCSRVQSSVRSGVDRSPPLPTV